MYDLSSFVFVLMVSICFIYLCHYDYRGGQSNFECSYKAKIKSIVSMYIGQGVSLEARYAAQAERRAANTAMAQASASAAAAAERASSASPTCLSPIAEMDSIASPRPTGTSADCPSGASIADDLTDRWRLLSMLRIFTSSKIVPCVPSWFCAMALCTMMERLPSIYFQRPGI